MGDIDGDGDADLVYAVNRDEGGLAWLENVNGRGQFHFVSRIGSVVRTKAAQLADIDGDSDLDLVTLYDNEFANWWIEWFENDGLGNFGASRLIANGRHPGDYGGVTRVLVADVDHDGDPDVVAAKQHALIWYDNADGRGTFGAQIIISTSALATVTVDSADFDNDGDLDLLTASFKGYASGVDEQGKIAWHENLDRGRSFLSHPIAPLNASSVAAADLDNDGDVDVAASAVNQNVVFVFTNTDSRGTFHVSTKITTPSDREEGVATVQAGDIDQDGDLDLITRSGDYERIDWFENTSDADQFRIVHTITVGVESFRKSWADRRSLVPTDIDLDGDIDLISGSLVRGAIFLYTQWDRVPGDVNGDGKFDSQDLVLVAQAGKYEDEVLANATYEEGDWNGDGDFDTTDLIYAFAAGCYEVERVPARSLR